MVVLLFSTPSVSDRRELPRRLKTSDMNLPEAGERGVSLFSPLPASQPAVAAASFVYHSSRKPGEVNFVSRFAFGFRGRCGEKERREREEGGREGGRECIPPSRCSSSESWLARPPSLKVAPLSLPGAGGSSFLSLSPSLPLWSGRERLILAAGLVKHGEVVTRNPYGRRH